MEFSANLCSWEVKYCGSNHPLDDHLLHGDLNLVTGHLLGGLDGGMVKEGILHMRALAVSICSSIDTV
ncbi:hypothetical protein CFP56_037707 [Quercus suber]|uniref:Uncharacterized protein n=1 Tax=Quercus suber TaxID=58331 RepID=A0AAW0LQZ4_QUESU